MSNEAVKDSVALWQALAGARAEMAPIPKRGVNPRFGSRYALLDDIIAGAVPALLRHGLVLVQPVVVDGATCTVHTDVVSVRDGARERLCSIPLTLAERRDAQAIAALVTYGRRIGLGAGLALALEEDDDANAATPPPAVADRAGAPAPPPVPPEPETVAQTKVLPPALTGDAALAKPTADWMIPAGKGKGRQLMSASSPEHLERFAEWLERRLAAGEGDPRFRDRDRNQAELARQWAKWLRRHPEDRKDTPHATATAMETSSGSEPPLPPEEPPF